VNRQIIVGDSKYGTLNEKFFTPPQSAPKSPSFAVQRLAVCLKHTVLVLTDVHICYKRFIHNLGLGSKTCQKQLLWQKLVGSGLGEHPSDTCGACRRKWRLTDCVLVARPRRCLTLSNTVPWQNWMAAYLGYTLQMKTPFCSSPVMVHDAHTRRRRLSSTRDYGITYLFHDCCATANMGLGTARWTALAWSRFSGVGQGTLSHSRHCVER